MQVVLYTKGQFNYRYLNVSIRLYESLKRKGFAKVIQGQPHLEAPNDKCFQAFIAKVVA